MKMRGLVELRKYNKRHALIDKKNNNGQALVGAQCFASFSQFLV